MNFWMSGEVASDIYEDYSAARKSLEEALQKTTTAETYGVGVDEWAIIYIIMPKDDPNYPEIRRYRKRKQEVEFRLKIDHQSFKKADDLGQRKLLAAAVLRSIDLCSDLKVSDFDVTRFRRDVVLMLKSKEWM